jgi:hypothetical protein
MLLTWFLLVAIMLAAYVVLDGFDLGIGVLHLFLARTEEERTLLIRTGCGSHTGHRGHGQSSRTDRLTQRAKCQGDCRPPSIT